MGLILDITAFDYPAPTAENIADRATLFCGLRVCVNQVESDKCRSDLFDFHFEGFPKYSVSAYRYEQGAFSDYTEDPHEGSDDDAQFFNLESFGLSEPTLVSLLAHVLQEFEGSHKTCSSCDVSEFVDLTSQLMARRYAEFDEKQKRRRPFYILFAIMWFLCLTFIAAWLLFQIGVWLVIS